MNKNGYGVQFMQLVIQQTVTQKDIIETQERIKTLFSLLLFTFVIAKVMKLDAFVQSTVRLPAVSFTTLSTARVTSWRHKLPTGQRLVPAATIYTSEHI